MMYQVQNLMKVKILDDLFSSVETLVDRGPGTFAGER